jgi:predicted GNAT family acetyltransferase
MNAQPTVQVHHRPERHRFELEQDGQLAGFIAYRERDGRLDLLHTEVDERFEGRGLGGQLVRGTLEAVRAQGRRIIPSCPFVAAWLRRHPEFADLAAA